MEPKNKCLIFIWQKMIFTQYSFAGRKWIGLKPHSFTNEISYMNQCVIEMLFIHIVDDIIQINIIDINTVDVYILP